MRPPIRGRLLHCCREASPRSRIRKQRLMPVLAACRPRLARKRYASCLRSILEPRNHGYVVLLHELLLEGVPMQVRLRRELPTDFPDPSTERQARRQRMALEGAQAMKEA